MTNGSRRSPTIWNCGQTCDRSGASTSTVGYDTADRMTGLAHAFAVSGGNESWTFAYSPASQMTASTGSNTAWDWAGGPAASANNTADGLNRDATIAAASGYDGNGNLIFDGTRHFTYDGENRLLTESGPVAMTLTYDPMGRLTQGVINGATTQFLYDGDNLVAEYDGANNLLRRYVHGPGVDNPLVWFEGSTVSASNANYLIADRQGSIAATANASGAVTANYTYDPYGVPNTWGGPRFRYTGQIELPEAQLYHYKARAYDPSFGHFLQTDPVGSGADLNLYAFVGEDPVNAEDPSGLCPKVACPDGNDGSGLDGLQGSSSGGSNIGANPPFSIADQKQSAGRNVTTGNAATAEKGRIGPSDGSGHSNLPTNRTVEQQRVDFNNPKLNGRSETERQEAIGMVAVPGAGIIIGAAAVTAPVVGAASARALGPSGSLFGRARLGGGSILNINANNALRVGWGWRGAAASGEHVFRISGRWLDALTGIERSHIDLFSFK